MLSYDTNKLFYGGAIASCLLLLLLLPFFSFSLSICFGVFLLWVYVHFFVTWWNCVHN